MLSNLHRVSFDRRVFVVNHRCHNQAAMVAFDDNDTLRVWVPEVL